MDRCYRLEPPDRVIRVDEDGEEHVLPVPTTVAAWATAHGWGYRGSAPNVTAATMLLDAAGAEEFGDLNIASQAFVAARLSALDRESEHVIGVRELREWVAAELPR
jgi:hypothetical protein